MNWCVKVMNPFQDVKTIQCPIINKEFHVQEEEYINNNKKPYGQKFTTKYSSLLLLKLECC